MGHKGDEKGREVIKVECKKVIICKYQRMCPSCVEQDWHERNEERGDTGQRMCPYSDRIDHICPATET